MNPLGPRREGREAFAGGHERAGRLVAGQPGRWGGRGGLARLAYVVIYVDEKTAFRGEPHLVTAPPGLAKGARLDASVGVIRGGRVTFCASGASGG